MILWETFWKLRNIKFPVWSVSVSLPRLPRWGRLGQGRTVGKVWDPSSSHLHAEPNLASSSLGHSAQMRKLYVLISKSLKWECLSHLPQRYSVVYKIICRHHLAQCLQWPLNGMSLLLLLIKLGAMINIPYQCFVKVRWKKINLN